MNRIDHNNYDVGERGEWRKYNPYNPYTGNQFEEDKEQSFKVDSLDDLFNDGETSTTTISNASQGNKNVENKINDIQIEMPEKPAQNEPVIVTTPTAGTQNPTMHEEKSVPKIQEINERYEDDDIDIQKELEAKFDELFGPIDKDN